MKQKINSGPVLLLNVLNKANIDQAALLSFSLFQSEAPEQAVAYFFPYHFIPAERKTFGKT